MTYGRLVVQERQRIRDSVQARDELLDAQLAYVTAQRSHRFDDEHAFQTRLRDLFGEEVARNVWMSYAFKHLEIRNDFTNQEFNITTVYKHTFI